jgi:hypothetical protein
MDVGKVVTALVGTLLIAFCLVTSVLYLLPLYQKIHMDQACRGYIDQVNASEGLSNALLLEFESVLKDSGLTNVVINCPREGQLKRRERQTFRVRGELLITVANGFLSFEEKQVTYEFEGWVYGKRIIN